MMKSIAHIIPALSALAFTVASCSSPSSPPATGDTQDPHDSVITIKHSDTTRLLITGLSRDTIVAEDTFTVYTKGQRPWTYMLGTQTLNLIALSDSSAVCRTTLASATGYVTIFRDSIGARSPRQLVIRHPLHITGISNDSASFGERVVIYGDGFMPARDSLLLLLNNLFVPLDTVYDDSIVFHVPSTVSSGPLQLIYRDQAYTMPNLTLTVTRRVAWRHCTLRIVGFEFMAMHRRTGIVDRTRKIDSSWQTKDTLNNSQSFSIDDPRAGVTGSAHSLYLTLPDPSGVPRDYLRLSWDSVTQQVGCSLLLERGFQTYMPETVQKDSMYQLNYFAGSQRLDPDGSALITIPLSGQSTGFSFTVTESRGDHYGDHQWTETTSISNSQQFGVGRIEIELTP